MIPATLFGGCLLVTSLWGFRRRRQLHQAVEQHNSKLQTLVKDLENEVRRRSKTEAAAEERRDRLSMVVDGLGNLDNGDKIAVLGNHDQWDGNKTELRLVSELERVGIQVLRNSSKKLARGLSSLYVAGTDDYSKMWF